MKKLLILFLLMSIVGAQWEGSGNNLTLTTYTIYGTSSNGNITGLFYNPYDLGGFNSSSYTTHTTMQIEDFFRFDINVYDELTGTPLNATATILNSTFVSVKETNSTIYLHEIVFGDVTTAIAKSSYYTRYYYTELPETPYEDITLDTFLLSTTDGQAYTLYTIDVNSIPIENATISIQCVNNTVFQTCAEFRTNPDGSAAFYLKPGNYYIISVSATDYFTKSFSYVPPPTTEALYIRLSQEIETDPVATSTIFDEISYNIDPDDYYNNGTTTFKYTVQSETSNLKNATMMLYRVYTTNETLIFSSTVPATLGAELVYIASTEDTHSIVGKYKMVACFYKTGYGQYCHPTQYFFIKSYSGLSTVDPAVEFTGFQYLLISIIVTMSVVSFLATIHPAGAAVVGLLVFGFMVALNAYAVVAGTTLLNIYILTAFIVSGVLMFMFR